MQEQRIPTSGDGPQRSSTPRSRQRLWLPQIIVLGALGLLWVVREGARPHRLDPEAVPRVITPRGDLAADEQATTSLFRNTSPSVVYITTLALRREAFSLNLFEIPQGTGSGFVWDQEGHVLTHYHVIQEASGAVTLADGSTWGARLVGVARGGRLGAAQVGMSSSAGTPMAKSVKRPTS